MRVLILSDLHLGTKASRAAAILDDLRHLTRRFDRVILNGDTLDHYESPNCHSEAEHLLRDVTDACRSGNGMAELLTGNHDPAISNRHWLYIEQAQTLVFHGDCVADITHPDKPQEQQLAARLRVEWDKRGGRPKRFLEVVDVHREVQARFARENPAIREPDIVRYLLGALFPPTKPFRILNYWRHAPVLAGVLGATHDKPVQNVVVGHSHRPGRWALNGVTVFNTGSFMPLSRPYAYCLEGSNASFAPLMSLLRSPRTHFAPLATPVRAEKSV